MKGKRIVAGIACFCWVAGLVLFFVGMGLEGQTKEWMTVIGNIVFFIGLAIVGVMWAKKRYGEENGEKEEDSAPSDEGTK